LTIDAAHLAICQRLKRAFDHNRSDAKEKKDGAKNCNQGDKDQVLD
jgi:hypothetical protein